MRRECPTTLDLAKYEACRLTGLGMARPAGFEPTTYGFGDRHSIQLSYGRTREAGILLAGEGGVQRHF